LKRPPELTYGWFNTSLLAICQALAATNAGMIVAVSALAGAAIGPRESLATLPLALQFVATMLGAYPASLFMRRAGRYAGFSVGAALGVTGGALAAAGLLLHSFGWFSAGSFLIGGYSAFALYYRYAAADNAPPDDRGRAVGIVLAGSFAAVAGPYIAGLVKDSLAVTYAGVYLGLSCLAMISLFVLQLCKIDRVCVRDHAKVDEKVGPFRMIARQPLTALLSCVVGYSMMTLVMSATPLAMKGHAHHFDASAGVMRWHLLAMFAPALIAGTLVKRFGPTAVIGAGLALYVICAAIALTGSGTVHEFTLTLISNGIAWSFITVAATALLMNTYAPAQREKVQGVNDTIVFAAVASAAAGSGALQTHIGWTGVNAVLLVVVSATGIVLLWSPVRRLVENLVSASEGDGHERSEAAAKTR
jgi:MFS family permease